MPTKALYRAFLTLCSAASAAALQNGCGLILGGEQRVDVKSKDYAVLRLDKLDDGKWKMLESKSAPDSGDVAYENSDTGAIISLNSICKIEERSSLKELSQSLLRGLRKKGELETREYPVDAVNALESTVDAETADGKIVRIRTVVFKKQRCTFDIMYVAPQTRFRAELPAFDRFLKGFHVE